MLWVFYDLTQYLFQVTVLPIYNLFWGALPKKLGAGVNHFTKLLVMIPPFYFDAINCVINGLGLKLIVKNALKLLK